MTSLFVCAVSFAAAIFEQIYAAQLMLI